MTLAIAESEASIIRIAGAGFRLSLLLNAASCQIAQSRIEFHSIAKAISLFSLTLKRVGNTLHVRNLDLSPVITDKAWELASQGQVVMVEIEHMLEKLQGTDADDELRKISPQERLNWCFRKQHVTYLLAQLESLKLSLVVMLQVLHLAEMVNSSSRIADRNDLDLVTDELLAQEKAETQNIIIIRFWSVRRVDRLWSLVEQEALDAAKHPLSQRINSQGSSSAMSPLVAATNGSTVTRLHTVTFGDIDTNLNDLERSPKDMVHLSEKAMEALLLLWIPSLNISMLQNSRKGSPKSERSTPPRVEITPDSEADLGSYDSDGTNVRGYYLEGNTTDWRKPHSQEARYQASQLRKRYSSYQPHVDNESDSENDESYGKDKVLPQSPGPNDGSEQRSNSHHYSARSSSRPHSNNMSSRYSSQNLAPEFRHPNHPSANYPPSDQHIPRSQPPQNLHPPPPRPPAPPNTGPPIQPGSRNYPDPATMPRSAPMNIKQAQRPPSNPVPPHWTTPPNSYDSWGKSQAYNRGNLQPRHDNHHPGYPLSTSSPETRHEVRFRTSPPRSSPRTPPSDHSRRSSREDRRERNKELGRTATRGIVGIGAIAGFMDALEAFQVL